MNTSTTPSRYDRKREQIILAATALMNERGASGMTMRDVARDVNLTPATLSYYFKGKDKLASAVFQRRLDSLERMVREASSQSSPLEKIECLLTLELERLANTILGKTPALAPLPTLGEYAQIHKKLQSLFQMIRGFLGKSTDKNEQALIGARGHMFIGVLFYLPSWVNLYPVDEFPRLRDKIVDVLRHGVANSESTWDPEVFFVDDFELDTGGGTGRPEFLRAATRVMNVSGYLGTSVDSIADELNVTKGSFYHHLDSKDELVLMCIRTNFKRMARALHKANAGDGDCLHKVSSAIATLLHLQFEREWPLLRSNAFGSLPPSLLKEVSIRSNRVALRFASRLIDGIAEGSVRPVDPIIASHMINSTLYSAFGLQDWASRLPENRAIELYASTLMHGIIDRS